MFVKIRDDGNKKIAYFIDSRKMIGVNEVGAVVLELLCNQTLDIQEIVKKVSSDYGLTEDAVASDINDFLKQVGSELAPNKFSFSEQSQTEIPLGVELEITTGCNLRCWHCLQTGYPGKCMPDDHVLRILDILADAGVFEVSIIGGEPFIHPHLRKILEHCAKREFAINIVTNGTLLNADIVAWLADIDRLSVFVSVDGPEKEHDRIRGRGNFVRTSVALQSLVKKGIATEVLFTLNALNAGAYRTVLNYCRECGVPCNFNLFKPFKATQSELILNPQRFFEIIIDLFQLRKNGEYQVGISNAAIVGELLGSPHNECRAAQSGLVITTDERTLTCPSLLFAGYYQDEALPRFDEHFLETWRCHPMFTSFRSNGFRGCQARAFIFCHDVTSSDPYDLAAFKRYLTATKRAI
jgi:MoaA/NifB/PqqE/SkfB family radical SAM enzyme